MTQNGSPSSLYAIPYRAVLRGAVDVGALDAALQDVVARHDALRSVVVPDGDGDVLKVLEPGEYVFGLVRSRVRADAVDRLARRSARRPFDLRGDLPVRAELYTVAEDEHHLLVVIHHLAGDGWSFGPFARDLEYAYDTRSAGLEPTWTRPGAYADYAHDRSVEAGASEEADAAYWRGRLAGMPTESVLPLDRRRTGEPTYEGSVVDVVLHPSTHASVTAACERAGVTPFMVLHAALALTLHASGAGDDVPVGTGVAGRLDERWDDAVGFFINTVVLRTDLSGDPTVDELLQRVRTTNVEAQDHQHLPFDRVVELVNPHRAPGRHPLFQVMLMVRNAPRSDLAIRLGRVRAAGEEIHLGHAKFDLTLSLVQVDGDGGPTMEGFLEYATDVIDEPTARALVDRVLRAVEFVGANPSARLHEFGAVGVDEARALTAHEVGPLVPARPSTLDELFTRQVRARGDATALDAVDGPVGYRDLDARVSTLAHGLQRAGLRTGAVVGLALPRSVDLVVAVLASARAGLVAMPLDVSYPPERLEAMLRVARPALVLVAEHGLDPAHLPVQAHAHVPVTTVDGLATAGVPSDATSPAPGADTGRPGVDDAFMLLFTSGSTGEPKGVLLPHRGLTALVAAQGPVFGSGPDARVLQVASPSFDAYLLEIVMSVLCGGVLVLAAPQDILVGPPLVTTLRSTRATHVTMPPSALAATGPEQLPQGLTVVSAGEPLPATLVGRLQAVACVVNVYGPTETTVIATSEDVRGVDGAPTIGVPRPGSVVRVLDDALRRVPAGIVGEVYVCGDSLAHGYLGRAALTASRFVADPLGPAGSRMYRTGDQARRRHDGRLEFVGRLDHQVKVRGYRIELGDIESALGRTVGVRHSVVLAERHGTDRRLVAHVVPDPASWRGPDALRRDLAALLPAYMVPAVVLHEALPRNPNGKVDRVALTGRDTAWGPTGGPGTPEPDAMTVHDHVLTVTAQVLELPSARLDDDFFDIGGHSLAAVRILNRLQDLGIRADVRDLFAATSLGEFADACARPGTAGGGDPQREDVR